jgi:hypothetical protein
MTDDDLGRAAATALKARFPEPDGVDLLRSVRTEPRHPRQRTLLAAAASVAAVVVVTAVALALSAGRSGHPVASGPSRSSPPLNGPLQKTPACRPGAADSTVRLGGAHLLGNRVPVKAGVKSGDVVRVIVRLGSRRLTVPATQSHALHFICSTGSQSISAYFRAVRTGSATVTTRTAGCDRCMQVQLVAHIAVVGNNNACCGLASSNGQLLKIGLTAARAHGAEAETIDAVRSTHAHAVHVIMDAGISVSRDEPVWVLQIKTTHEFVCTSCSRPPGANAPKGHYIQLVLDASSLQSTDNGFTNQAADLTKLGHVITLFSR